MNKKREAVGAARSLTAQQSRLWQIERAVRGHPVLHTGLVLRFDAEVDVDRFRNAVRTVIGHHELLRLGFRADEDDLLIVDAQDAVRPRVIRAGAEVLDDADRLHGAAATMRLEPFDFRGEPLVRVDLVTDGDRRQALVITTHRLVCDAESLRIIATDLASTYSGETLPDVGASYFELTAADQARLDADAAFWSRALQNFPVLRLGDREPAGEWSPDGRGLSRPAPELAEAMPRLRIGHRATDFALFATASMLSAAAASGVADICLAGAFNNRLGGRAARTVGPLAQAMLVRLADATVDFDHAVAEVKKALREGMTHQRMPFEEVVELVAGQGVPRDRLTPMILNVDTVREPWPSINGSPLRMCDEPEGDPMVRPGQADLHLDLGSPDGPLVNLTYDGSYLSDEYAHGLVDGCVTTLTRAAEALPVRH